MPYRQDIVTQMPITTVAIRSIAHNSAADFLPFGKFTQQICKSCMTFGAHKLVHSELFRTTYTNFDNCCQRYIVTCGKKIYTGAYLETLALNYCVGIFFKSLSYLYKVVCTNISADFCSFTIFDRNVAKIVAPPSDENDNNVVLLKSNLLRKTANKQTFRNY